MEEPLDKLVQNMKYAELKSLLESLWTVCPPPTQEYTSEVPEGLVGHLDPTGTQVRIRFGKNT